MFFYSAGTVHNRGKTLIVSFSNASEMNSGVFHLKELAVSQATRKQTARKKEDTDIHSSRQKRRKRVIFKYPSENAEAREQVCRK